MQTLTDWLNHLEAIHPSEIDMGLERIRVVAERLGVEQPAPKVITVAGTNGKGSTVTTCASILNQAGLKVGSYMSPHIHHYGERVRINGQPASDGDLCNSFAAVEAARGEITLTYFEFGTLAGLWLFKEAAVDVVVLEVGLGGRLDAVNIVEPDVAVITSIGLDHQDWLGDDIASIAREKAGIFRMGKPAVCGERNPPSSLFEVVDQLGIDVLVKQKDYAFEVDASGEFWQWQGLDVKGQAVAYRQLPVPSLPLENAATALQALILAFPELAEEAIRLGLARAQLDGRLQRITEPFNGLLDVGHNPQAAELLASHLNKNPIEGKRVALLAMLADKDAAGVVQALNAEVDEWWVAGLDLPRGQSADQLKAKVTDALEGAHVKTFASVASALSDTRLLDKQDEVVILGSFYTVGEALAWLKE